MAARAFGRNFEDFPELSAAELKLLESCRSGAVCLISDVLPDVDDKTPDKTVAASFLRFLALGGDEAHPIHEHGIRVRGAFIDGVLDLEGVATVSDLWALSCRFDSTLILRDSHIRGTFILSGSRVPGLTGDRMTVDAGVFLRSEFTADGEVRLLGATISGNLECGSARFIGPPVSKGTESIAFHGDSMKVNGNVFLKDVVANANLRLIGATIGGDIDCSNATFEVPADEDGGSGDAFSADRARINGNLFLDNITANGSVRLAGAKIAGQMNCRGGTIAGNFMCDSLAVAGAFVFVAMKEPTRVDLSHARVGVLVDDLASWGEPLYLTGFTYDRLDNKAEHEAESRLQWLDKQTPEMSGRNGRGGQFRPQPWLQLRKSLKDSGLAEDARKVGIALERRRRHCGQVSGPAKLLHWSYGFFTGYGYRPMRLLAWSIAIWLACAALYAYAARHGVFSPTEYSVFESKSAGSAPAINYVLAPPFGGHYPTFNPLVYSLNVFLPIVSLGQESAWAAMTTLPPPASLANDLIPSLRLGNLVQDAIWIETLLGWLAGLLLVATVSGLARKQDDA